ncbi:hypothetical protein ACIXQE_18510, partial [Bacteroides fragilis]
TGVIHPDTKAPGLEEARRKLVYYNMNKAEQMAYDEHINAIMIQNDVLSTAAMEGRQEGLAEGRMEEKQANARRMKALNLPVETICQVTGLSAGEIENL